jgi:hypothetical protein
MRKAIKTDFGNEVIFAQEEWFTASFINLKVGGTIGPKKAEYDFTLYVDEGIISLGENGNYEFGYGKTILIKKGEIYRIEAVNPSRLIKIANIKMEDKDFSGGQ